MSTMEIAEELARTMNAVAHSMKKDVVTLISDMNQPLGYAVGNALEIRETIAALEGKPPADLKELVLGLAGWMMVFGGAAKTPEEGCRIAEENLMSGKGLEKFRKMVAQQGGDPEVVDDPDILPTAQHTEKIASPLDGYVTAVNALEIGLCSVALGAGRESVDSKIDMGVGFIIGKKIGDRVKKGEPLVTVHYNDSTKMEAIRQRLEKSFTIGKKAVERPRMIHKVIKP
jgi:pyrimidine-nucleoside phosphorylase